MRRLQTVTSLVETGRMSAEIRIPNAGGPVLLEADLRTAQIETTVEIPAAARTRSLTRVQWLLRQLDQAPPELRIEALTAGHNTGPCDLLNNLVAEPGLLVPDDGGQITSFRLPWPPAWAPSEASKSPASSAASTWPWTASTRRSWSY
ncbi:hypothetical protein ACQPZ8_32460 [Actinomadura nitritigenes]|uniref:hypothetical protein n=1 Tax=Actinomadura nitritigenes TaxID=134602 RepID=UPI003D93F04C